MNNSTTATSLRKQRALLCQQLQQNRRYLAHHLSSNDETFPRSLTMRLLTQQNATIPMVEWPKTGMRIYRIVSSSFYFINSVRQSLFNHKDNQQKR